MNRGFYAAVGRLRTIDDNVFYLIVDQKGAFLWAWN
jgi:hypothetical protein